MNRRSRHSLGKRRLGQVVVLVVMVVLVGLVLPRLVSFGGMAVLYPLQVGGQWFSSTSMVVPVLWRDKLTLQREIALLREQLAQQSDTTLSHIRLREENVRLRTLLGASTTARIAAGVIARPAQLPYDVLQIDQGSSAGVEVGAPVYSNGEEVIGVVSQTYPRSALVTLLSTPGFTSTGFVAGADLFATLDGLGAGVIGVAIPQGIPLRVGDVVHIPSIQPGVIGRIVLVEREPTQPQQFGYIVSSIPLASLRYVSVGQVTDITTEEVDVREYVESLKTRLELPPILQATTTATGTATTAALISPQP